MEKLKKFKKIILIILLIIIELNLISTFFIFIYYKYKTSGLFYGSKFMLLTDLFIRDYPIPLKIFFYEIIKIIKNFGLASILFIVIFSLISFIPEIFASRIIFFLKPLHSIIIFNFPILFFVLWVLINYLFLILLLKKLNLEKIYKLEIFFIPVIFNLFHILSAYDYDRIGFGILILYFLIFVGYKLLFQ